MSYCMELLSTKRLPPSTTQEQKDMALDAAQRYICNYCHIDALPEALDHVCASLAADILRREERAGRGQISSLREGDTDISYAQAPEGLIGDYSGQMRIFRRLSR